MGMTMLGYTTTLPVKMEETLSATAAVARVVKDALVVADMPFGSYQCGDDAAMANAVACLKAGADAVKLEGGARVCGLIHRMTEAGIPVLAHVGMMPQNVNAYGGFKTQGKTREAAAQVLADAQAVEAAGAFAVTLECVPDDLAATITAARPSRPQRGACAVVREEVRRSRIRREAGLRRICRRSRGRHVPAGSLTAPP